PRPAPRRKRRRPPRRRLRRSLRPRRSPQPRSRPRRRFRPRRPLRPQTRNRITPPVRENGGHFLILFPITAHSDIRRDERVFNLPPRDQLIANAAPQRIAPRPGLAH